MAADRRFPNWVSFSGVGFELVGAVVGFTLIGYWIDRHYTTQPWGLVGGIVLGLVGGLYNLVKRSLEALREAKADDEQPGADEPSHGSGT
jgi:ATP synthase protein I